MLFILSLVIMTIRCAWVGKDPKEIAYHDGEWGTPVYDDQRLFEFLLLEGAQAGLSWSTILKKRENYRQAFDGFDARLIARYDDSKQQALLKNAGIVRNQLKIKAAIANAREFLQVQSEFNGFSNYIWQFVNGTVKQNHWQTLAEVPAQTVESQAMSRDLKQRGFKFVGPTICYAFMQAVGMVNDHTVDCYRHRELIELAEKNSLSQNS